MDSFDSFRHCSLLANKVSHALRTPLGICLGALDDLASGYKLSEEELRDAQEAARNIVKQLDLLREFSSPISEKVVCLLADVTKTVGIRVSVPGELRVEVYEQLFSSTLTGLWRYAGVLAQGEGVLPEAKCSVTESKVAIEISVPRLSGGQTGDFATRIEKDSRIESLGVSFSSLVLPMMGGELFLVQSEKTCSFIVRIAVV